MKIYNFLLNKVDCILYLLVETLLILITATALNMREHVGAFSGTRRNETEPSTQEELSFIDKHQQKQSDQNITILIYQNKAFLSFHIFPPETLRPT